MPWPEPGAAGRNERQGDVHYQNEAFSSVCSSSSIGFV
jgi:hypothetical protein